MRGDLSRLDLGFLDMIDRRMSNMGIGVAAIQKRQPSFG